MSKRLRPSQLEFLACAEADAQRLRDGSQDAFLWKGCMPMVYDGDGRPRSAQERAMLASMTPRELRDYLRRDRWGRLT